MGDRSCAAEEERVILHCDCNSFFASVETVLNPAFAEVPMAVCGSVEDRHGIVLAKNEKAKKYGIETAETVWSARKKCKDLVIAPPHYDAYVEFSHRINCIYAHYTELVEPFSIDESWLDVTHASPLFGDGLSIAEALRQTVKREIGLTISVGVSFNKMTAKIGSDYKKPNAVTVITRQNYQKIVYPLPVDAMMYIGPRTTEGLHDAGIHTIGELASATPSFLTSRFGHVGEQILRFARGEDTSPVISHKDRAAQKSISNGMTFRRDLETAEEITVGLSVLCEEIAARLRSIGKVARTVAVTVKDTLLQSVTHQASVDPPTALGRELANAAFRVVEREWNIGRPIRALTVSVTNFAESGSSSAQFDLFDVGAIARREREEKIEGTVDDIRDRYGRNSIASLAAIGNDFGAPHGEKNVPVGEEVPKTKKT